ncbi:LysM peptidoglycan-binding domain-containing protein [Dermacoccaceae bacterium W4C1]
MSAVPVFEPGLKPTGPFGRPQRSRHLRSVPTGAQVSPAPAGSAVRLTVRGRRLMVTLALLTLLAVGTAVAAFAGGGTSEHTITVQPGQTLSEVAAQELPDLAISTGVSQIQLANSLDSLHVSAGQKLVIPAS